MKPRIASIWFCLTVFLLSPFAPAALSLGFPARITSPRPNRYFSEGGNIPLTLEFDCCIAQNGAAVNGNFFQVEVERYTWDNAINGRLWLPHLDLFSVAMTPCAGPLAPCQGSRIIDLTHGLSMDPTNAPPADAIAYRVRARGCPVDPSNGVNLLGPWSDWVTFHVGKHPLAGGSKDTTQ